MLELVFYHVLAKLSEAKLTRTFYWRTKKAKAEVSILPHELRYNL